MGPNVVMNLARKGGEAGGMGRGRGSEPPFRGGGGEMAVGKGSG